MDLLVATTNQHKLREIRLILNELGLNILSLKDLDVTAPEVIEDSDTFRGNAIKKAVELANFSGILTMADDSGLCIDALDGRPGVFSARYAGFNKSDADNRFKVLTEMDGVDDLLRTAYFCCSIAISCPNGLVEVVEGTCNGVITREELGDRGFGYDSIFYCPSKKKTFAQIPENEKNLISHRANALKKVKGVLRKFIESSKST